MSLVLGEAVASDLRFRKISNRLILFGILSAVIFSLGKEGITFANSFHVLRNMILPVVLLYLLFLCGAIGAGDIKLLSVIGGFTGLKFTVHVMILTFLVAGVWSLVLLIRAGSFQRSMSSALRYLVSLTEGNRNPYRGIAMKPIQIPFSAAIYAGVFLSYLAEALF